MVRTFIASQAGQLRTFFALTQRNLKVIVSDAKDICIDGALLAGLNVLLFAYLFPAMGMSEQMVAPVFIGSLLALFINLSFSISIRTVFDLRFKRFIDYLMTLPLSKYWFFACAIMGFFLELFLSTIPLVTCSVVALHGKLPFANTQWLLLGVMYLLSLLILSIFFLACAVSYQYGWFLDNMWPRRLAPVVALGCVYVPWFTVHSIAPAASWIMLLNPLTYMSEGIRASMLGQAGYIDSRICLGVLIMSLAASLLFLSRAVQNRLNPV